MIQSMTGFGSAEAKESGVSYRVELRSLNSRYFKANIKLPESFQRYESRVDKLLRERLTRGSVTFNLWIRDENAADAYQIDTALLQKYLSVLKETVDPASGVRIDAGSLLSVPGVCQPPRWDEALLDARFAVVERLTDEAAACVTEMRRVEGATIESDLQAQCEQLRSRMGDVGARSPVVVEEYHKRLRTRVQQLMNVHGTELDPDALAREVAIYAERCDVNEELSRIGSHLDQFDEICTKGADAGRRLDFLAQELLRESNTIGSKANDAEIARHVVEMKAAIDRIKEQVQNVV